MNINDFELENTVTNIIKKQESRETVISVIDQVALISGPKRVKFEETLEFIGANNEIFIRDSSLNLNLNPPGAVLTRRRRLQLEAFITNCENIIAVLSSRELLLSFQYFQPGLSKSRALKSVSTKASYYLHDANSKATVISSVPNNLFIFNFNVEIAVFSALI